MAGILYARGKLAGRTGDKNFQTGLIRRVVVVSYPPPPSLGASYKGDLRAYAIDERGGEEEGERVRGGIAHGRLTFENGTRARESPRRFLAILYLADTSVFLSFEKPFSLVPVSIYNSPPIGNV